MPNKRSNKRSTHATKPVRSMNIEIKMKLDDTLLKALEHQWKQWHEKKVPTKAEIQDWLEQMIDGAFNRAVEIAYKDGVIDDPY